jgi:hypothetical protein
VEEVVTPAPTSGTLQTALWLLRYGLWPIPISPPDDARAPSPGKSPIGRGWGKERPSFARLRAIYNRYPDAGVGIVLGPLTGVVDLEVDDPLGAAPLFDRLFPGGPPPTLGWRSARGEHRIFRWDHRLEGEIRPAVAYLEGGAAELRIGGRGKRVVTVCPPSAGSDGGRRAWNGTWDMAPLPEPLLKELDRLPAALHSGSPRRGLSPGQVMDRYASAALRCEADLVRGAAPGTRNRALNRAAFCLGQLVASGLLERAVVEVELTDAALAAGLPEQETLGTLRSGLEAGLLEPRGKG